MIYEHECPKHGVFTESRPLKDYKKKAKCPKCGRECDQVLATPMPVSQSWRAN